ncbi:DnaA N-terminal domain-containing protein [Terriglobus albidus]|uniref:DnaA N-terminal domain-containing protein n=1 Tax=Terriglobus albidus TaxID=1592106 RepID=UPI0021E0E730|nr:DnaA N-terminal domain-containing protein [Terriglobus albidus]
MGSTHHVVSEAVRLFAAETKTTPHAAGMVIYRAALEARKRAVEVNRFWFEDGKWRTPTASGEPIVGMRLAKPSAEETAERMARQAANERVLEGADRAAGLSAWQQVSAALRQEANAQSFATWVKPLRPEGVKEGRLILRGPNEHFGHVPQQFNFERFLPQGVTAVQMIFGEASA